MKAGQHAVSVVGVARSLRPTWIEVDAAAIRYNVRILKELIGESAALFTTLKSNACGFDLEQAGPLLDREAGVHGISLVDGGDAVVLRRCGVTKPILLFGGMLIDRDAVALALQNDFILTAHDPHSLQTIAASGQPVKFVVEFNVGAERLGFAPERAGNLIPTIARMRARLIGVTSHMHVSEEGRQAAIRLQFDRFLVALEAFRIAGIPLRYSLIASSQTLLETNDMNLTAVDPGHLIFGMVAPDRGELGARLRCALHAVKSRLIHIREVHSTENAAPFKAKPGMRVGVFPFGASDGLARIACAEVLIGGKKSKLLIINAEHAEVDLSAIPEARVGDEVVIFGRQGDAEIRIHDVETHHTKMRSRADVVRNISPFIPRIYTSEP